MISWSSRFIRLYLPLLFYMGAIFALSSFHKVALPFVDRPSVDKIYHAIEYAVLGYLIIRALEQGFRMYGWAMIAVGIILCALYGVSDEIHQFFVPGRYFSYWDMAANTVGAALGCWIYLRIRL